MLPMSPLLDERMFDIIIHRLTEIDTYRERRRRLERPPYKPDGSLPPGNPKLTPTNPKLLLGPGPKGKPKTPAPPLSGEPS